MTDSAPSTTPSPPDGPGRRPRFPRVLRLLAGALLAVVLVTGALLVAVQSPAVGTRIVLFVLGRIELPRRGTITVREVRGNWIQNLEFDGFRFARGETLLVAIDTLRVRHDPLALLAGRVDIARLDLRGVTVTGDVVDTTGRTPGETRLSVGDLLHGRFYEGMPIRLHALTLERGRFLPGLSDSLPPIDDITLAVRDGRIGGGPMALRLDRLALRSGAATLSAAGAVRNGRAELSALDMQGGTTRLSGAGAITTGTARGAGIERMELRADAQPLALADLRAFVPGVRMAGDVTGRVALAGPRLDALDGTVALATEQARVDTVQVGVTRLDATFTAGRADLTLRTVHEGASLGVTGWMRPLDARPTYDLAATADRLPRRVIGIPAWEAFAKRANFATSAHVRGGGFAPARFDIDARMRGAAGRADLTATVDTRDSARWEVKRLVFDDIDVARLAGQPGPSALSGSATARGQGGALTGTLMLTPSHFADWTLGAAEARLALDPNGAFRLTDGRFSHLVLEDSDLSGHFRADGRNGDGRAWLDLDPSTLRGQPIESGQLAAILARGNLTLDGAAKSAAGSVQLAARARPLDKTPTYTVEELRFDGVDAGAWSGGATPPTNLTGTLAFAGRGTAITDGTLHLEPSTVGAVTIDGADGTFDVDANGRARGDFDVRTPGGTATLAVAGDTTAYHATGAIPFGVLAHLVGRDSLPSEGALTFEADGHGGTNPHTAQITARATARGSIGDARVDTLDARLRLAGGIATLDTLFMESNVAEAHGSGRVALFDTTDTTPSDVHLTLTARDLEPLEPILGLDSLGAASATFTARLHGPATHLAFDATGEIHSLAVDHVRLVEGTLVGEGTLDRAHALESAQGNLTLRSLHGGGAKIAAAQVDARWADRTLGFDATADLDARHGAIFAGTATQDSAGTLITLTRSDVRTDSSAWSLTRPARFTLGHDRFRVENLEAHSARGVLKAHGAVDRRGTQDLDVALHGVGLDFVTAWMGRPDLGGTMDGTLELRGPAAAPQAKGELDIALRSDGKDAGAVQSKIEWNGRRLDLTSAFTPPTGSPLTLAGLLPLALTLAVPEPGRAAPAALQLFDGDVDLRLTGDDVALASLAPLLDPRQVTDPAGRLDADLRLSGPSNAIAGSGKLTIKDGAVTLPALGVTYRDAQLGIELEQNRILLREARVASNKGAVSAEGKLTIVDLTRVEPDLRVTAKDFEAIRTRDMHFIASGDLTVTGRLLAPVVRGKASIENSELYLTPDMMAAANAPPPVPLTAADIRMLEETFGPITAKGADPVLRLYDASDLDIAVEIERNTWVRQRTAPRLALELAGTVRVKKLPGAEPELYGRIEPVPGHGYVEQFARRFDFAGGEVLLNGPVTSHIVDIQTTYKKASSSDGGGDDVVVKLDVTGRVDELKLTLSSEPAMSPTEIVTFIATGQTTAEKAIDASSSTSAGTLAAQTALSQVSGRFEDLAQDKIGLDVVQIRQDAVQGATLVAGRYVNPRLYIGFRQPVQYQANDNTSTSTSYRTQVEVEYEAYRWLLLNVQGEASEVKSFFRVRRAY